MWIAFDHVKKLSDRRRSDPGPEDLLKPFSPLREPCRNHAFFPSIFPRFYETRPQNSPQNNPQNSPPTQQTPVHEARVLDSQANTHRRILQPAGEIESVLTGPLYQGQVESSQMATVNKEVSGGIHQAKELTAGSWRDEGRNK